ncbi:M56 family metallopeptidase [Rhodococcus sp. G-MC3]|uniref:M56 family metallopeptidase n=1 Tax=Rhodococcus sp. G-MC3 TaxID=3046209 RepID=UPI0024B9ADA5|nr:M56 family metallopeptidase [Rhodococcus sp. G-MC3]MDJ0392922.1 M56 family metallopeptidase [Rhodococcus sp. G-MC3]
MTGFLLVALTPWILCIALWPARPILSRSLTPAATVFVVPVLALVTAFAVASSAAAVGAVLVSQPVPWLRVLGAFVLAVLVWRLCRVVLHGARVFSSARAAAAFTRMRSSVSDVVVIDDDVPDAFASPSAGGVVMVTSALIEALDEQQVAAVVAHERAHLRFRHHFWIQSAEVSAEMNPLLRSLAVIVRRAAERQADEFAALGDRQVVLEAIARVALLHSAHRRMSATDLPGGSGGDIVERVRALAGPVPPPQKRSVVLVIALFVVALSVVSVGLFDVVQDVVSPEWGEPPTSVFR